MSGELPAGWVVASLGDVVTPRSTRSDPAERPDAPYVGLEHVEPHTNRLLATVRAGTMASASAAFQAGDVLYGRMRPYLNKVVSPGFDGLASAEFIVMPAPDGVAKEFLLQRLSATDFVQFACAQYEGDRPRVKFDQLANFKLLLPPAAEQARIVSKLEELLSDLDAGVAELKAAQRKLQQYRQSLLKAAVEGSLTAAWRAAHPAPEETGAELLERILRERRARWEAQQLAKFEAQGKAPIKGWQGKYPEPVGPDRNDLPQLPVDWVWASVDQLSQSVRNGVSSTPNKDGVGLPILRINAVRPMQVRLDEIRHLDMRASEVSDYFVEAGDLLATRYNGSVDLLGVFGLVRGVTGQMLHPDKLIRMKPVLGRVLGPWLEIAANSGASRRYIVGRVKTTAGQTGISGEDLKKMPIPLPPVAEQSVVADQIAALLGAVEQQASYVEHGLAQSTAQRQNLLRAAFAGQLVPQDPADEPATALLARIRAERAQGRSPQSRRPRRAAVPKASA